MVNWSNHVRPAIQIFKSSTILAFKNVGCKQQLRQMSGDHGHHQIHITPSRFQWKKYKDLLHFYVMLGVIPIGIIVACCNIFIGPAQLEPIPEDYEPKHWEYHKHPITRFLARYVYTNPQQEYEKYLHYIYEEYEKGQIRLLEEKIRDKMAERHDYQAYYYRPVIAKYHRIAKQANEELEKLRGDV